MSKGNTIRHVVCETQNCERFGLATSIPDLLVTPGFFVKQALRCVSCEHEPRYLGVTEIISECIIAGDTSGVESGFPKWAEDMPRLKANQIPERLAEVERRLGIG